MIPSEVSIRIDEKALEDYIESQLQKQINQQLLLVDINKLSELTCMSVRYLEGEILKDPRVKIHERKKNRNRWWLYEPPVEAIKDILDERQKIKTRVDVLKVEDFMRSEEHTPELQSRGHRVCSL